jgi:hypothetical protein
MDVKMLIREQAGNGVDSVPYVVIEGKRRDITVVGAQEIGDYLKELVKVARESIWESKCCHGAEIVLYGGRRMEWKYCGEMVVVR